MVLVDSPYLAAFLRKTGVDCNHFADAALAVELPEMRGYEKRARKELVRSLSPTKRGGIDGVAKYQDGPNVSIVSFALKRSLITSRKLGQTSVETLLVAALDENNSGRPLQDFLTRDFVQQATTAVLVELSRQLYIRALGGAPLAESHLTDLVNLLPDLPLKTATCLYLGLLAAIYFDEENVPRLPPANLILSQALRQQDRDFATPVTALLQERLLAAECAPVYIPSSEKPKLRVEVLTQNITTRGRVLLVGLQVDGIELITQAQGEEGMQLAFLFENRAMLQVREILDVACRLFGIPGEQIEEDSSLDREVGYEHTTGFQLPSDVYRSKE